MPASMIVAVMGSIPNVIGMRIATPVTGPMPGQHADQGAGQAADKTVEQVDRLQRNTEAEEHVLNYFHFAGITSLSAADQSHGMTPGQK